MHEQTNEMQQNNNYIECYNITQNERNIWNYPTAQECHINPQYNLSAT